MDCGEGPGQACSSWLAMAPGHCNCTARPGEARLSSWRLCLVPPLEPNLLQTPPEEPPWPDVPPAAPQSKLKPRLMGETPATEGAELLHSPDSALSLPSRRSLGGALLLSAGIPAVEYPTSAFAQLELGHD